MLFLNKLFAKLIWRYFSIHLAATGGVFLEKFILDVSQNSQEKTYAG